MLTATQPDLESGDSQFESEGDYSRKMFTCRLILSQHVTV